MKKNNSLNQIYEQYKIKLLSHNIPENIKVTIKLIKIIFIF